MENERLARYWMIIAAIALVVAGVIGFVPGNPIASAEPDAIFRVNEIHNIIHIVTGLIALGIGFGLRGASLANAAIGFGVLYAIVFLLLIVDPELFGLFENAPANMADHVLHAALAVVSIALGYLARDRVEATVR